MATVTLSNILPSTPPSNGWKVTYRILGTGGPFLTASGSPFSSLPIVFATGDPSNTDYEGYVVTDCGSGNLGAQYYWETANFIFSMVREAGDVVDMTPFINGSFAKVDWGDGTINGLFTHTYVADSNYTIKYYSSTTTKFDTKVPGATLGRISSLAVLPPAVTNLNIYTDNPFTTLDTLVPNSGIIKLRINNEILGLSIFPPISAFTSLQILDYIGYNNSTINLSNNTLLTEVNISSGVLSSIQGLFSTPSLAILIAAANNLPVTEINAILVQLDTNGQINGSINVSGQIPLASPSGAGITAKANLITKGWTVITD